MPTLPVWRAFVEAAVIHEWRETDHKVHIYSGGKSAVVTYLLHDHLCDRCAKADHAGQGHALPGKIRAEVAGRCRPVLTRSSGS